MSSLHVRYRDGADRCKPRGDKRADGVPYEGGSRAAEKITLEDCVFEYYNALLDSRIPMREIDEMDFLGYIRLRAWKERKAHTPKRKYIDEVWKMKPG